MIGGKALFVCRRELSSSLFSVSLGSQSADLGPRKNDESVCHKPVRVAVGSLIWLSGMTRPGIANAVRVVTRQPTIL